MLQDQQFSWDKRFAGCAGIPAHEDTRNVTGYAPESGAAPPAPCLKNARDLRAESFPVWIIPQKATKTPGFFKTGTAPDRGIKRI
jgi:hypothetical protein